MKKLSYEEFDAFESKIDTKYFGIESAKVILKKACASDEKQNGLLEFLQNFEFVVIINKANDPSNNCWLGEKTKAFLTDVNVQLSKKVLTTERPNNASIEISDNFPQNKQVVRIAETSFKSSRFLNDPYLPMEKAKYIYADITKNSFRRDGRFFVLFNDIEGIAGFLLFSIDQAILSSRIELIAVDENFMDRGIGRLLIGEMERYLAQIGVEIIEVGTQLNNINALRFYTSYGFSYFECNSIYHYWPLKL